MLFKSYVMCSSYSHHFSNLCMVFRFSASEVVTVICCTSKNTALDVSLKASALAQYSAVGVKRKLEGSEKQQVVVNYVPKHLLQMPSVTSVKRTEKNPLSHAWFPPPDFVSDR